MCRVISVIKGLFLRLQFRQGLFGSGNGAMIVAFFKKGFHKITGADYSKASLALAARVLQKNGCPCARLVEDDMTDSRLEGTYDVLLDKGTYDAVGLSKDGKAAQQAYRQTAAGLLPQAGLLIITSCNCTVDELQQDFEGPCVPGRSMRDDSSLQPCFEYVDHVRTYPKFKFGGVEGTHHCTVAFSRK